ncbi:hypothetical protein M3Y99_01703100 [Aphelenchoides fujianensis]|nr:hypothetical protein M3Y99_01703100 [Aphelenchoides fujianensis]
MDAPRRLPVLVRRLRSGLRRVGHLLAHARSEHPTTSRKWRRQKQKLKQKNQEGRQRGARPGTVEVERSGRRRADRSDRAGARRNLRADEDAMEVDVEQPGRSAERTNGRTGKPKKIKKLPLPCNEYPPKNGRPQDLPEHAAAEVPPRKGGPANPQPSLRTVNRPPSSTGASSATKARRWPTATRGSSGKSSICGATNGTSIRKPWSPSPGGRKRAAELAEGGRQVQILSAAWALPKPPAETDDEMPTDEDYSGSEFSFDHNAEEGGEQPPPAADPAATPGRSRRPLRSLGSRRRSSRWRWRRRNRS